MLLELQNIMFSATFYETAMSVHILLTSAPELGDLSFISYFGMAISLLILVSEFDIPLYWTHRRQIWSWSTSTAKGAGWGGGKTSPWAFRGESYFSFQGPVKISRRSSIGTFQTGSLQILMTDLIHLQCIPPIPFSVRKFTITVTRWSISDKKQVDLAGLRI